MSAEKIGPENFKLAGGGLVGKVSPKGKVGRKLFGIGVGLFTWVPMLILSLIEGSAFHGKVDFPFLFDPVPYSRFIVAIPLMFLAGTIINQRLASVVKYIWLSGVLPKDERSGVRDAIDSVGRWRDSITVDIVLLTLAYIYAVIVALNVFDGGQKDWYVIISGSNIELSKAGWYYTMVSLPIYQFILMRWLWRVLLWWRFLWQISRLELSLVPTHPDRAGGLGIMEMGQMGFAVLILTMSVVMSANMADYILHKEAVLAQAAPAIVVFTLLSILFIAGPLFLFIIKLTTARLRGLVAYGDLGDDLFRAFGDKWAEKSDEEQRKLLGDVDPSSLADYGYAYEVVAAMRVIPFSKKGMLVVAVMALLPFSPLLLIQYSVKEALRQIMGILG